MDGFMPPNSGMSGMFPSWDVNAMQNEFSRSPERTDRDRGERGSEGDSDSESRRHRRKDKDRHREHRDRYVFYCQNDINEKAIKLNFML